MTATFSPPPSAPEHALRLVSPAKINLYLRIVGRRPDGYHDLETVMVPLEFGDEIVLASAPDGIHFESDDPRLPSDSRNLAVRAAELVRHRFAVRQGVAIRLRKRIPIAAGLAGGSSNAATMLQGLNRLWNLNASAADLGELAGQMGSDINFFLQTSAALCRGRGEQVTPVPCRAAPAVLLINPGFGIATKWAYTRWAELAETLTVSSPPASVLLRALETTDVAGIGRALYNSLELPALRKFPVLGLLKEALRSAGAAGTLMTGSGATVFGLFAERAAAERAATAIRVEFGENVWSAVTRIVSA
ncbi:4-(cytidine 5'-diphospho)-2-C-methyl-D-erythritol kinase [bacterium]|nr:4-(cytidine 5'-diphospho)-2-C-methyl-D-erythritol kinase [bacterium]